MRGCGLQSATTTGLCMADATVVCRELGMSTGIIIILVYAMIVFVKSYHTD